MKAFLPDLIAWNERHEFPFEFSTEASINLADDTELLELLRRANFFLVFVGIETPNTDALIAIRKKQNTRRKLAESIHRIYAAGIMVTAGFIVGFDTEQSGVAAEMTEFIREAAIPISLAGLLAALPNTQLTRRLAREGRLHPDHEFMPEGMNDHVGLGLNFDTKRPRAEVLKDYIDILRTIYDPKVYCDRLRRLAGMLDLSTRPDAALNVASRFGAEGLTKLKALIERIPDGKGRLFWRTFLECQKANPRGAKAILMMIYAYLHLGPFAHWMAAQVEARLTEAERNSDLNPQRLVSETAFATR